MLKDMPVGLLKIDMAFLRKAADAGGRGKTIVREIINLARELDIILLTEGVETKDSQVDQLQARGCQMYQGYFFGSPCRWKTLKSSLALRDKREASMNGKRKSIPALVALFALLLLVFPYAASADGEKPRATREPLVTQEPAPLPEMPERDAEGFLPEEGEFIYENDEAGLWIYLSDSLQVEIRRQRDERIPLIWSETDIRTRGEERFRTVMTDLEHPERRAVSLMTLRRTPGLCWASRMISTRTACMARTNRRLVSSSGKAKSSAVKQLPSGLPACRIWT